MKQFLLKLIWITSVAVLVAFIAPNGSAADPSIWAPQPLSILIEEGLANNQDIMSLESQVKAR
ncbi:MAG: hypothetical protein JRJ73_16540 [Deltaproteobacteria bacterium]|nr:hypothetical protein [Deltaproteobacteria bacterium]